MKNLKNLFIASALTLSSASAFANAYTDYLSALEAESNFNTSYLATYKAQPDFTTAAGKLEAKIAEIQGYWATAPAAAPAAITSTTGIDAAADIPSYLSSLAEAATQVSVMRELSAGEAASLAAAEKELISLLNEVAK